MPVKVDFTKKYLEELESPAGKSRLYVYDSRVNGLCLSVTTAGTKSFLVYRKLNGKPIRVTLGRFPDITVSHARKLAIAKLAEIADGKNPIATKRAARQRSVTLQQAFDDYMASRAQRLSANTKSNYKTVLNTHLSNWANKPLSEITRDNVEKKHRQLSKKSPTSANKAMRILRAIFNYANGIYEDEEGRGLFPDNPTMRLSTNRTWNPEKRRQTVLKPSEIGAWFHAVISLGDSGAEFDKTVRDYLIFTLLHGLRRREASLLTFDNIDLVNKTFTVPKTKNKQPISLPLSSFTAAMLESRCRGLGGGYTFPGLAANKPLNDPRKLVARVREECGNNFTIHDLRRSFTTMAESLDISAYAVKALVNHSLGSDVTSGYIVMDVERLRGPTQTIAQSFLDSAGLSAKGLLELYREK